jgi:hypothetical protein
MVLSADRASMIKGKAVMEAIASGVKSAKSYSTLTCNSSRFLTHIQQVILNIFYLI